MLTLQYLRAIEALLRARFGQPSLRLSDYFDLIGGTSTGAIIAAALALGKSVDEIEALYVDLAERIFRKPWYSVGAFVPKFGRGALVEALQAAFGAGTTMGSDALRTGLLVVAKRMDTGSSWLLTNCPNDVYFAAVPGQKRVGNCNMLLWQIVRASTAAPHYFKPEALVVGTWLDPSTGRIVSDSGEFVDGGVTPANNPSLQCLRAALIDGYGFKWRAGHDDLLLISVGTGLRRRGLGKAAGLNRLAGLYAFNALVALMDDCNTDVELTMQWLSESPTARRIDGLVGTLKGQLLAGRPLLTYQRYNIRFDQKGLGNAMPSGVSTSTAAEIASSRGAEYSQATLDRLAMMDRPGNMPELKALGALVAGVVQPAHFPASFDP